MTTPDHFEVLNKIIKKVEFYLKENNNPETLVVDYHSGTQLAEKLNLKLSNTSCSEDELLDEITNYLKYSVRTTHPQFNNQLNAGFNLWALIGEIISYITNTSMATYEISPVATLIEKKLIDELNSQIGFDQGGGIMVTGGSNANLLAIHCARAKKFPQTKIQGNPAEKLCVFVSSEGHYSFQKAMYLLGLGSSQLIKVNSDQDGVMDPKDLEVKILNNLNDGKTPLMIASTAGTTVLGNFDKIWANDEIAKKYQLWHHVDGS